MKNKILEYLKETKRFQSFLNMNPTHISKSNEMGVLALTMCHFYESKQNMVLVVPSLYQAQKMYDALVNMADDEDDVLFFPSDDLITMEMYISSDELKNERIHTLETSFDGKPHLVISNYTAAVRYEFEVERWKHCFYKLAPGMTISFRELENTLVAFGYRRVYTVTNQGEFCIRGSILDFFPFTESHPVRLDFFDDELEQIKSFDPASQLSSSQLDHVWIHPLTELIYTQDDLVQFEKNKTEFLQAYPMTDEEKEKYELDFDSIVSHAHTENLTRYLGLFGVPLATICDFFPGELTIYDETKCLSLEQKTQEDIEEYCENIKGYSAANLNYFGSLSKEVFSKYEKYQCFEGVTSIHKASAFPMDIRDILPLKGDQKLFCEEIEKYYLNSTVILAVKDKYHIDSIKEALFDKDIYTKIIQNESEIQKGIVNIVPDYCVAFDFLGEEIRVYNEETIFRPQNVSNVRKKGRYRNTNAVKLSSLNDLHVGDYVVHYDRGIGRYLGLQTLELSGKKRDYIYLQYAGEDYLYIPIENFKMIQKYSGSEGAAPKLTKLGTAQWEITKRKVKAKAKDISQQLIMLYAAREMAHGLTALPDTPEQIQFEADFPFEETPDQLKIIEDVKRDMESTKPMDRLICGDVGYGKTEIALRAAFKSVMSGFQVAYLCPTTVLCKQHYSTFLNRFERYGARVEMISRYNTAKEIKDILKRCKEGSVDVLVGTHRILSKDVVFHNLGLLIVDEEQRFGVNHKEKIKEMKVNVDSLTLTATPIPRTMQMAIMGIKDLSTLETPPKNRYPIQTYVLERNSSVIKEAIERELSRDGQVFYLYNRTDDIDIVAGQIQGLVPDARVCFAHGKMNKKEIEEVIDRFIDHEYDVLVSTTIIETGIDIPNSNTLLIHNADLMGLSQLYQLRGRVGRSDRVAYAYLMFDPRKKLTSQSEERLAVIKEFTELGSGFKIAMRDLNIRGAGDVLGSDQSGFIDTVGLDMYLKILEETIKETKGQEVKKNEEKKEVGDVLYSRTISKDYIEDDDTRIQIHRRIDALSSLSEYDTLYQELVDRFGKPSFELTTYMKEKLMKYYMSEIGFDNLQVDTRAVTFYMSQSSTLRIKPDDLFMIAAGFSRDFSFQYKNHAYVITYQILRDSDWMGTMNHYLDQVMGKMAPVEEIKTQGV